MFSPRTAVNIMVVYLSIGCWWQGQELPRVDWDAMPHLHTKLLWMPVDGGPPSSLQWDVDMGRDKRGDSMMAAVVLIALIVVPCPASPIRCCSALVPALQLLSVQVPWTLLTHPCCHAGGHASAHSVVGECHEVEDCLIMEACCDGRATEGEPVLSGRWHHGGHQHQPA